MENVKKVKVPDEKMYKDRVVKEKVEALGNKLLKLFIKISRWKIVYRKRLSRKVEVPQRVITKESKCPSEKRLRRKTK